MKYKLIPVLIILLLIGYACKKEKTDPLSLLTKKEWKPTIYIGPDVSKISAFNDCELDDLYLFGSSALTIKQSRPNCNNRQFTNGSGFKYTLDFKSNTIQSESGTLYNITALTADTLKIQQVGSYGTGTVKFQYIFIH